MDTPRLIRVGDEVLEVVDVAPGGSMFLLNRTGLLRRRLAELEHQADVVRAELAAVYAEERGVDGRGTN
jgi:hypothetical protein